MDRFKLLGQSPLNVNTITDDDAIATTERVIGFEGNQAGKARGNAIDVDQRQVSGVEADDQAVRFLGLIKTTRDDLCDQRGIMLERISDDPFGNAHCQFGERGLALASNPLGRGPRSGDDLQRLSRCFGQSLIAQPIAGLLGTALGLSDLLLRVGQQLLAPRASLLLNPTNHARARNRPA